MTRKEQNIPEDELIRILKERITWTVPEASLVTGIGKDRLYRMIKEDPECPFAFTVGKTGLRINVQKFMDYIGQGMPAKEN